MSRIIANRSGGVISNVIGEALIAIRPETTGFASGVKTGVLGAAKNIAVGLGGIFAAEKVFDFGKEAVAQAALVQKAGESVQATMGAQGKAVTDFANGAAANLGISAGASLQFSSGVGLMGRQIGLTKGQMADMSVKLQELSGSVGLIKGVDPTSYFDSLQKAVLGNTRGFKQLGIAVTPIDEQQAALALHIKGTSTSWTDAQKAMILTAVATSKLGPLMKQAKNSSGDWADQMIILRAHLKNVEEDIGTFLLPIVQKMTAYITAQVLPAIQKWWDILRAKLTPILHTVAGFLREHADKIREVGKAALIAIPVIGGLTLAFGLLAGAIALLTSPVTIILALGTAAVYAYEHWKPFRQIVQEVVAYIQKNAAPAFDAVRHAFGVMVDFIEAHKTVFTAIAAAITVLTFGAVGLVAVGVVLYEKWKPFRDVMNDIGHFIATVVAPALVSFAKFVLPIMEDAVTQVTRKVKDFINIITETVNSAISAWHRFSLIRTITEDVWGVVVNTVKAALTTLKGVVNAFMGLIRGDWGRAWQGILQILTGIWHQIEAIMSGAVGILGAIAGRIGLAVASGLIHKIQGIPGAVSGILGRLAGVFLNFAFSASSILYNAGVALMKGLLNGITSGFNSVKNFVSGIASTIASIKGPLDYDRQLLIPHGVAIMAGLHEGLTTGFGPVKTLVGGMAPQLSASVAGGVGAGGGRVFQFAPGSIVIHDARDPGTTARRVLDEAIMRAR